ETVAFRNTVSSSIVTATMVPARTWFLSAAPAGPSARQSFYVLNPTRRIAHVIAHLVSSSGDADVNINVAAMGGSLFWIAPDPAASALRWARITSTNSVPIVVARSTMILSPIVAAKAQATKGKPAKPSTHGSNTAQRAALLPALSPGFGATTATSVRAE